MNINDQINDHIWGTWNASIPCSVEWRTQQRKYCLGVLTNTQARIRGIFLVTQPSVNPSLTKSESSPRRCYCVRELQDSTSFATLASKALQDKNHTEAWVIIVIQCAEKWWLQDAAQCIWTREGHSKEWRIAPWICCRHSDPAMAKSSTLLSLRTKTEWRYDEKQSEQAIGEVSESIQPHFNFCTNEKNSKKAEVAVATATTIQL